MTPSILSQIQGTWLLESIFYKDSLGMDIDLFGNNPIGIAMFDSMGYVNVQIGARNRTQFISEDYTTASFNEFLNAFKSYMAFFGTYIETSPGLLKIQLYNSMFPNWQGKDIIRYAKINENTLYLTTPPVLMGNFEMVVKAKWKRQ